MNIHYFLGANSRHGFYSLYDGFPPAEDAFLHIIKGGPGGGKSGFMGRLAAAAESRGLDVEYVLCSGDPDSLDGIYIPALRSAWCDGTAPHALEPALFAVSSDYVNLGAFCAQPLSGADAGSARRLNREYKALYRQAYSLLAAAASLRDSFPETPGPRWLSKHIGDILDKELLHVPVRPAAPIRRFFSAISCKGQLRLSEDISKLCPSVWVFDQAAPAALDMVVSEAKVRGAKLILSPDPLDPSRLSAVLLPDCGLAFLAPGWDVPGQRHISPGTQSPKAPPQQSELYSALMSQASSLLARAKALHDELEAVYRPYIDFPALDAFTAAEIKKHIHID